MIHIFSMREQLSQYMCRRTSLQSHCNRLKRNDGSVEVLLNWMRDDVLNLFAVLVDEVVGERRLWQRVHICQHV